ncbi:MAG: insulinase family protein [Anaerolineae bacterium]|jgi:zinc protease|nr:insulinase family protein [Anaerolineae bacterium]MBT3712170.1 insulinase family protein [Anaerolineae bacterium]MBT4312141.1 insulinase family protein [Anaerolineae bacterium]MBT4459987.1 insulinase family protein [Anaerolineae bacterium]MBT4842764.1 insulinase family protein [Anaerolineae bacterium]
MTENFTKTTLANGLTVMLKEIHTAPLISSWIWYRVGSRNEVSGKTGISHWVEHMQFKGTPEFPANVLDKAISREGGVWNASTSLDWTTYYETMPADKIDLALRLEADRMENSLFDSEEVASERTVIISEREGNENNPMFKLGEAVQAAAFRVHSYHHRVIGDMADLHSMTRDDLYAHYKSYYAPNNAILGVAGDFDTKEMLERITELFGGIPSSPSPRQRPRPEPEASGEMRLTVEGTGDTTYVQACYHFPSASDPDFFPLTVLDSLLSGASNLNRFGGGISNKTSRLYRALVETELTVGMGGGAQATVDPYLYSVVMLIHPERTPEEALAALDTEILHVQEEKVSAEEVARAVKQAKALFAYGSESVTNQAFWMGYAEIFADYDWFLTYLDKLAAVTPDDVQRVAKKYFQKKARVVGIYLPVNEEISNE